MGGAILGQMVQGYIGKQSKQGMSRTSVSKVPPWPLLKGLPWVSCPSLFQWRTAMWKHKSNKPLPPASYFWSWWFIPAIRTLTRTWPCLLRGFISTSKYWHCGTHGIDYHHIKRNFPQNCPGAGIPHWKRLPCVPCKMWEWSGRFPRLFHKSSCVFCLAVPRIILLEEATGSPDT